MSQLVLPNSIDAGTPVAAAEVQGNFTAIRDILNGQLEGGSGVNGNLKANSVTAREVIDAILSGAGANNHMQEGVFDGNAFKVTPGAGLQLNYANGFGYVDDDNGIIGPGIRVPVSIGAGSTVTIAANGSGNPRIDQVVLTMTDWGSGTVSVVQGTASVGATLDNRTGAANLPLGAIRLADILMPSGFGGPFVQATHIRDRRQYINGFFLRVQAPSGADYNPSAGSFTDIDATNLRVRAEFGGGLVYTAFTAEIAVAVGTARFVVNDSVAGWTHAPVGSSGSSRQGIHSQGYYLPAQGSHVLSAQHHQAVAGNTLIYRSSSGGSNPQPTMFIWERPGVAESNNTGA